MLHAALPRILCPVDFSSFAERALRYTVAMAGWFDSEVTLLHVGAAPPSPVFGAVADDPRLREAELAEAQTLLDQWAAQHASSGVPMKTLVRGGRPVEAILAAARELSADLVVMGTHGRSGFERLMLGSVAEKVLRKATVPVLTVPGEVAVPPADVVRFERVLCAFDGSPSARCALSFAISLARERTGCVTAVAVVEPLPQPVYTNRFDTASFSSSGRNTRARPSRRRSPRAFADNARCRSS